MEEDGCNTVWSALIIRPVILYSVFTLDGNACWLLVITVEILCTSFGAITLRVWGWRSQVLIVMNLPPLGLVSWQTAEFLNSIKGLQTLPIRVEFVS